MEIIQWCTISIVLLAILLARRFQSWGGKVSKSITKREKSQLDTTLDVNKPNPYHDLQPLHGHQWQTPPIQNCENLLKPKYHLTMALETISLSELIVMDNTFKERLRIRRQILDENYTATLQCQPVCASAVFELYTWLIRTYLPTRFPSVYVPGADGLLNTVTTETIPYEQAEPLAALKTLASHVDTDFLLLLPCSTSSSQEIYTLEAFALCFPSGFNLRHKMGQRLAEIHALVPGYKEKLEKSMDRFFARLENGQCIKRGNWSITTDPILFKPEGNHAYSSSTEDALAHERDTLDVTECRLRSERQTLFRLPKSRAVVFSFKTYLYGLEDLKSDARDGTDDGFLRRLIEAIEGLKKGNVPEMDYYKKGDVWREKVVDYLRS